MKMLVLLKMVPDVVEELEVAPDGKSLDTEFLRLIPNEPDDHALEEALLLKERLGGTVTVLAPDAPEVDEALFTALAKGADRALKLAGVDAGSNTAALAQAICQSITAAPDLQGLDLILTGTQANDDLDTLLAPALAHGMGLPFLGIVTQVAPDAGRGMVVVQKECPKGIRAEFEMPMPAVLGIQAAEKPPRYVPVAKVRAAMKTQKIEAVEAGGPLRALPVDVIAMDKPVVSERAEMLEGSPEAVAEKVCEILTARGLL
jgi:electron transfer flavoprotein beta subunit